MKNKVNHSKTLILFHIQILLFPDLYIAIIAKYVIIYLSLAYAGSCRGGLLKCIQINEMPSSSSSSLLRFVKLTEHARSPTRESRKTAGLDLYSATITTGPARGNELIFADLQMQLPDCYGRIALSHTAGITAWIFLAIFSAPAGNR